MSKLYSVVYIDKLGKTRKDKVIASCETHAVNAVYKLLKGYQLISVKCIKTYEEEF